MSTYRLYTISGAPRPWRVHLAFALKNLAYEDIVLQASAREQKSEAFLAVNPRGRVPVLRDGDFVLPESIAILAHLERKHPEVPIFGTTAEEAARIWEEVCEGDQDGLKAFGAIFVPFLFGRSTDVTDAARANADAARQELRRLDARLAEHAFVCGDRPTAGDCVDYPQVRMITRLRERAPDVFAALGFEPFERAFPNVHAWMARIEALPGFERTIPVHWRE